MLNYVRAIPTKVYFGEGSIHKLEKSLSQFGKNVLMVYGGGSIKRSGLYDEVMKILKEGGFVVTELAGVDPNPRVESVAEGSKLCKENNIDVVLAIGGGSTIDCSKAICVGAFYEGDDYWQMILDAKKIAKKALPLVDILTLSATGSEYDAGGVISNLKTNQKLGRPFVFPSVSICDPTYTYSVNAYQTAAGSADMMSHIMEDYFCRTEDCDLSDGIAEAILKSVMKNCPIAIQDPTNYSARANLMTNATIACSGIPAYGKEDTGWPCHGLQHELSAFYDITHGVGLAILTPRWMRHILEKDETTIPRFEKFARNVMGISEGSGKELAMAGINALESYFKSTGIPMTLTELHIGEENFDIMAEQAMVHRHLEKCYVPLSKEDCVAIYKACL